MFYIKNHNGIEAIGETEIEAMQWLEDAGFTLYQISEMCLLGKVWEDKQ